MKFTRETWLICGGRDFDNLRLFNDAMGHLAHAIGFPQLIIEGGATGADRMARHWGFDHEILSISYNPNWRDHGKAAGPIRNQRMIDEGKPDRIIAFPGGRGTADMVRRARAALLPIVLVEEVGGSFRIAHTLRETG